MRDLGVCTHPEPDLHWVCENCGSQWAATWRFARELERLRKIEEAAREHGECTCRYYPGYPRGDRHAPECDNDPELRAALEAER